MRISGSDLSLIETEGTPETVRSPCCLSLHPLSSVIVVMGASSKNDATAKWEQKRERTRETREDRLCRLKRDPNNTRTNGRVNTAHDLILPDEHLQDLQSTKRMVVRVVRISCFFVSPHSAGPRAPFQLCSPSVALGGPKKASSSLLVHS